MATTYFLSMQSTYQDVEVALFHDQNLLEHTRITKTKSSADLMPAILNLLQKHALSFAALSFIAVNQGPGPFTTLRVVIATANGISFATKLPLVGVDGLDAILKEQFSQEHPITVALLNAFNNDAYFGIDTGTAQEIGSSNIDQFLSTLISRYPEQRIRFIGNGVSLFKPKIEQLFGTRALIAQPIPEYCSLNMISTLALDKWKQREGLQNQLLPLYLKS